MRRSVLAVLVLVLVLLCAALLGGAALAVAAFSHLKEGGAADTHLRAQNMATPLEYMSYVVSGEISATAAATTPCDYAALRDVLNQRKSVLDAIPPAEYQQLANAFDPYLTLKRRIAGAVGARTVTNAWLKIVELLTEEGLVPTAASRAHFEAEFPGAMITALLYLRPKLNWVAGSLYPSEGNSALRDVYGFYAGHRDRWLMGPRPNAQPPGAPDTDGDLTVPATVAGLAASAAAALGGPATLYVADGGMDVGGDYNRQEEINDALNRGQIACGLLSLAPGGALVTKQYTFFERGSREVIAYLATVFDRLAVVKPRTSRRLNSEVYLVGQRFRGLPAADRAELAAGRFPAVDPALADQAALCRATRMLCRAQEAALDELLAARGRDAKSLAGANHQRFAAVQREWAARYLPGARLGG